MNLDDLIKNMALEFGIKSIILDKNTNNFPENVYVFRNGIKSYVATETDFKKNFGKTAFNIIQEFGLYHNLEKIIKFYLNMKYYR